MFNLTHKNKFSILIVDDEPKNITLLAVFLKNAGYSFESATSGKEALEKIELQDFHLILLDIMMPNMDGYEVCDELKKKSQIR